MDAETDAFVKNIQAQYEDKLNEVVAKSDVDLVVMDPATGNRLIRNQETNLGNLCADAYRTVLGADIAFVNGGGIRADIPAGDITYGQVIAVHPFGNTACVVEATGQEIADALEMTARSTPGENGGFLQVSGLKYTIDLNIASSVKLDDKSMFVAVEGLRRVKNIQVQEDDPAMKALRMMGYDMFVPGNHEFNYGMTILQRLGRLRPHRRKHPRQ